MGRAALDAAYPLARAPLAFSEQGRAGLAPHALREVWLFASDAADASVDIAPTFERKLAARLEHRSQTADPAELRARWRERAAAIGATAGLALAEALTILHLGDG